MFKKKDWIFNGESGKKYSFQIKPKTSVFPESAGIFVLTYTHPRGHLAGYEVNKIIIGCSENIKKDMKNPPQREYATENCWNCTFLYLTEDKNEQQEIIDDLCAANKKLRRTDRD